MKGNGLIKQLFDSDMGAPLPIGEANFNSEIDKIQDNDALLKFCQAKNKAGDEKEKLNNDQKKVLVNKIKKNILSQGKNLSIDTIFELSILINGKVNLDSLYGIKISELDNFKFGSLEPIFNFIKKHKGENNNAGNRKNYLNLIDYFILLESVKTCNVKDFLEAVQFDFANQDTYKNLAKDEFTDICGVFSKFLEKDKKGKDNIAKVIEDILSYAPCGILNGKCMVLLLRDCKKENINISIPVHEKRILELYNLFCPKQFDFYCWCMLLSCCKDHSMSQDSFEMMIKKVKLQGDFTETALLRYISTNSLTQQAINGFGKYIFTPSLINFIKQKFNFDKNYNLEQVLKDTFGKDNLVEGNDCDLGVIFYRLHFENYLLIPHKKEDVIKLFQSTKSFLPEKYRSFDSGVGYGIKKKFNLDVVHIHGKMLGDEIYKEFDGLVEQIFIEKGVLPKDKGNDNQIIFENELSNQILNDDKQSKKLTLEELKIFTFSNFEFGNYGITKEKFETLIPDTIDDKCYFRWLLEFYRRDRNTGNIFKFLKEDFMLCIKRYKFIDQKDFNDFCCDFRKLSVYDQIRFDVDCVNALLGAYGNCEYAGCVMLTDSKNNFLGFDKNKDYIADYMRDVVKNVKDQNLLNKIKQKFGIKLDINNQVNQNQQIHQSQDENRQHLDNYVNEKHDEKKTPFWLIIITLGGIFWGPWLFEKMFGSCCNFKFNNKDCTENNTLNQKNENPMPNQNNDLRTNLDSRKSDLE